MKDWGIQTRVLFLALVPLTVAVLLISLHFTNARIQDLEQALRDRGQTIATRLASACEYGIPSNNRAMLAKLAQSTLREADVMSVTITSMDGTVLAAAAEKDKST